MDFHEGPSARRAVNLSAIAAQIPSSVRAIKPGPMDFPTKPFSDTALMAAVRAAIARDSETRAERGQLTTLRQRYLGLTPREREVMPLVVSGLLNKQAAAELGISEVTLQIQRRNVMKKWRPHPWPSWFGLLEDCAFR